MLKSKELFISLQKTAQELRKTGIAKGDPDFNLEYIGGKYANKQK
jgi:hypothetical protein